MVPAAATPNPHKGEFKLQLTGFGSSKVPISVLNAKGSRVQTRTVNTSEGDTLDVNIAGKAKGLYVVRVVSEQGVQVQKITVQ